MATASRYSRQKDMMAARGWLRARAAAARLGVAAATIYRWMDSGEVESTRVGRTRYVSAAGLARRLGPEGARMLGAAAAEEKEAS